MSNTKDPNSKISDALQEAKSRAELEILKRGLSQAADSALDSLERQLFGKIGGAEEALWSIEDPLERIRAQYNVGTPAPPPDDPVARYRAELEALKKGQTPTSTVQSAPTDPLAEARAKLAELKKARGK